MFNNASQIWAADPHTGNVLQLKPNLESRADSKFAFYVAHMLGRWEGELHSRILMARGLNGHTGSTSDITNVSRSKGAFRCPRSLLG